MQWARPSRRGVLLGALGLLGSGGSVEGGVDGEEGLRERALARYWARRPRHWGLDVPGVISRSDISGVISGSEGEAVALTFDACGGRVHRYDEDLIEVLRREQVPATLFINQEWAEANPDITQDLVDDPLFEIANHGDRHVPLSVRGWVAYGVPGTEHVSAAFDEIRGPHLFFQSRYGVTPRWFRPGTAHCDEVAADLARWLGTPVVGLSVNADWGATASADQVANNVVQAGPGDIVLGHFNHPGSGTAAGISRAIEILREREVSFARLQDVL
ncbi:polysaccharide deacetylase family protein [Ornithinimicrobium sp. Y1847]|uniref:polysaccharide deacetylase family protein n=1 Tax=unclassified Ornithinimicrobium TaxID=2615080 RepID=UPI003B66C9BB